MSILREDRSRKCLDGQPRFKLNKLTSAPRSTLILSLAILGMGLSMLTGCGDGSSNSSIKRIQVAPNKSFCSSGLSKECLLVREFDTKTQEFSGWITSVIVIKNFNYENGYLHDIDIRVTCGAGIGEGYAKVEFIKLNAKTPSTAPATGLDAAWPGLC